MPEANVVIVSDASTALLEQKGHIPNFTDGDPVEQALRTWLSPSGGVRSGIWECTPGSFPGSHPEAEWCYVIKGRVTLTPKDGEPNEAGPGSVIFFPAGWQGTWEIHETVRKVFVKGNLA